MNTSPTPSAAHFDADLIHSSTRTLLSTNATQGASGPCKVMFRFTKLVIRWVEGEVTVRFSGSDIKLAPSIRRGRPGGR